MIARALRGAGGKVERAVIEQVVMVAGQSATGLRALGIPVVCIDARPGTSESGRH